MGQPSIMVKVGVKTDGSSHHRPVSITTSYLGSWFIRQTTCLIIAWKPTMWAWRGEMKWSPSRSHFCLKRRPMWSDSSTSGYGIGGTKRYEGCPVLHGCKNCNGLFCYSCYYIDDCRKMKCKDCSIDEIQILQCMGDEDCRKANCATCVGYKNFRSCGDCEYDYCFECLLNEYRDALVRHESFCSGCAEMVISALL